MSENKQDESMYGYVLRMGEILFHRNRRALSVAAGLPFGTVAKVMRKEVVNPRSDTVQALFDTIKAKELAMVEAGTPIPDSVPPAKKPRRKAAAVAEVA